MDGLRIGVFCQQSISCGLRWRAMKRCKTAHRTAVHFLRPWVVQIARAQARLNMADRNFAIIGGNRARHHRGRVALDDHPIGLLLVQNLANLNQSASGQRIERLAGRHQIEIMVRGDARKRQHLIEHFAMLSRHANAAFKARIGLQCVHKREQLNRLWPSAENCQNALCFCHDCPQRPL